MVSHCYICKITAGQLKNISFHSIPKKGILKAKWIAAIGREVKKTSSVCSRHFQESDFYYQGPLKMKRYLKAGAVPCVSLTGSYKTAMNINEENKAISEIFTCKSNNEAEERLSSSSEMENKNEIISKNKKNFKRKMEEPLTGPKRCKVARVIGNLRRDDFTSDESFNIVQNYIKTTKLKVKVINNKVGKLNKKVTNHTELMNHLKKNALISEEALRALEFGSPSALHELFSNSLRDKKPVAYSAAVKEFACTLSFYSTSAYKYVRKHFLDNLPHPQTVRKWFSKIDYSPGINKPVLDNIRKMVEDSR